LIQPAEPHLWLSPSFPGGIAAAATAATCAAKGAPAAAAEARLNTARLRRFAA
jgi:hypothetical protein